ncbi:ABC transporter permease [Streptomyces sp. NBC_01218]|uniref:ABC transporter permease n=1 Tax=unclassified Streptomyces TaxID=2593676 RepID=UPI0023BA1D5D|nr:MULTISPECIES: ABC transporter permease [unclassified Streptomyces]WEH43032.1 ABC transporter permease subunit [Streptomyces sp. AM 2-1-1]WSQ54676.1 ABC transporter permease [Streptomyces sp. NBC_01218]
MSHTAGAVVRSEWVKARSVRAVHGSLTAVFVVTVAIALLVSATIGQSEVDEPDVDLVFSAFYALNFGQIAAIAFGATALSSEFTGGALRVSLTAVPRRGVFYAAKMAVVGVAALIVGEVAGLSSFLLGQSFMGDFAIGLGHPGALRAVLGSGVYLALMALFAAGLTALLRSAVLVLSILIPFILLVSFVVGDMSAGVADFFPDRAGQTILHENPPGSLGPWSGLAVTAVWASAAVLAGWWSIRSRDV